METQTCDVEPRTPLWREGTRFCHLNNCQVVTRRNKPAYERAAITIAYRILSGTEGMCILEVGFAFCSPADMQFRLEKPAVPASFGVPPTPADPGSPGYVKSIGRDIAYQRLLHNPSLISVYGESDPAQISRDFIETAVQAGIPVLGLPNSWIELKTGAKNDRP